jgi:cysteine-rich repeat protein
MEVRNGGSAALRGTWRIEGPDGAVLAGDNLRPVEALRVAPIALACVSAFCGNGALDPGEDCDAGDTAPGDGCGETCLFEGCGDGFTQAWLGEQCDDGNDVAGDGCAPGCTVEACAEHVLRLHSGAGTFEWQLLDAAGRAVTPRRFLLGSREAHRVSLPDGAYALEVHTDLAHSPANASLSFEVRRASGGLVAGGVVDTSVEASRASFATACAHACGDGVWDAAGRRVRRGLRRRALRAGDAQRDDAGLRGRLLGPLRAVGGPPRRP